MEEGDDMDLLMGTGGSRGGGGMNSEMGGSPY